MQVEKSEFIFLGFQMIFRISLDINLNLRRDYLKQILCTVGFVGSVCYNKQQRFVSQK